METTLKNEHFTDYTSDDSVHEEGFNIPMRKRKLKIINPKTRQKIINIYDHIRKSWPEGKHCSSTAMVQKTSEASGISEYSIYEILREILEPMCVKSSKKASGEVTKLNHSEKSAIRKLVHSFYLQGEMPTIYKIYYALQDDATLPNISMGTLRNVLRRLRFKYLLKNNTVLIESNGAALRRINYIREVLKIRNENRRILFVDKTSVNAASIAKPVCGDHPTTQVKAKKIKNKSPNTKCFKIVHVGNEDGFLEGCEWLFESSKGKIEPEKFEQWFSKVLDVLKEGDVVIMQKASYNVRLVESIPTFEWPKEEIKNWLISKNISIPKEFQELNNKACFLLLVEKVKNDHTNYTVEKMAKKKGVTMLRLPKYHNELSPFESVWPVVKNYVAENVTQSPDIKDVVKNALAQVTLDKWKEYIEKVKKEEVEIGKLDNKVDDTTESYLKFVGNSHSIGSEITSETESESDSQDGVSD